MEYNLDASYLDSENSDYFDSEAYPWDSYTEAKGRSRPGPVKPSSGRPLNTPRPPSAGPTGNFVTQAQFDAAMARARSELAANSTAIKTVDGRVRTVIGDVQKLQATTRKDIDKLRSDLRTTQTLSALIPLMTPPNSPYANVIPLLHLVGTDALSGVTSSGTSGSGSTGGLLGNNANLIAIAALVYASGILDKTPAAATTATK